MASLPSSGRPGRRAGADIGRIPRSVAAGTVALTLCSGALAGCGGSSKASGSGANGAPPSGAPAAAALPADQAQKPACGLLTQVEVEAAVGARVSPGRQDGQEGRSQCGFALASAADQSVIIISTSSSGVPAAFEAARKKAVSAQPVGGGDAAFVTGGQALVRKGTTMVAILIAVRQAPAQLSAAATKLAQAVGSRL